MKWFQWNFLCFPCIQKIGTKFPVLPMPWVPWGLVVSGLQHFESGVKVHLHRTKVHAKVNCFFDLCSCSMWTVLDSLWTHLEAISPSLSLQFQGTFTKEVVLWFLPVLVVLVRFRREFGCGFGSARRWAPRGCWAGWAHCACPAVAEPAPPRSARSPPPC